jgi:hypothetical protein
LNVTLKGAHAIFIACLAAGTLGELRADDSAAKSNADVMSDLCRQAVERFCADVIIPDTTVVSLNIESGEANRFFTPTLVQAFRRHFASLYTRRSVSTIEISASIGKVSVLYGEAFSDGLFSGRKCMRTIDLEVQVAATKNDDGKVLWAGTTKASHADTVYVSDIRELQKSSQWLSNGVLPAPSALERFIEPIIIGGAAGVAVYLFFTIRS